MSEPHDVNRRIFLAAGGAGAAAALFPQSVLAAWAPSAWTAAEKANVKVVTDFLASLEAKDAARLGGLLTDDAAVRMSAHSQTPALIGRQLVADSLGKFFSTSSVAFEKILETVAAGPMVINNRIDRITGAANATDLHYLGVFFLKDGKIREWNDYEVAPSTPVKPGQPL